MRNDSGLALRAEGVQIDQDMLLAGGLTAAGSGEGGAVSLLGAHISGNLNCTRASLRNDSGPALVAYGAQVSQDMYLSEGFTATEGQRVAVNLRAARVGGAFYFRPTRLEHKAESRRRLAVDGLTYAGVPLDPGRSGTPPDGSYWAYTAVLVMLSGGAGLDMGTVGSLARAMAPAGGIAPIAGQVEYRWPISPAEERDNAPDDEDILALFGTGDLRDHARDLAKTTPAAELRDAYQVTAAMTAWADAACTAVEQEIASGQPGDAVTEWVATAFGPARLMMAVMLQDKDAGPASTAATAMMLILIRNLLRAVRQLMPDGNFDILKNPMVGPSMLTDFLGR